MKEKLFKYTTMFISFFSVIFLLGIILSIFIEGFPLFREVNLLDFIFGKQWNPTHYEPEFGILALIVSSLIVTIIALIVSIPLGVGSALYISEVTNKKIKEILKPVVELLAGIPSVIYGLFGMTVLGPFLSNIFGIPIGLNAFTAGIILGIMVIPIISSISEDAINSVPNSLREASYALGANKWETIIKVVLPASKSGVITSIILGFGRAIGETMVVLMVAGGAPGFPKSIFRPVRPMTSSIAAEMGEATIGSLHYHALFAIGIILFIITFFSNLITNIVKDRSSR